MGYSHLKNISMNLVVIYSNKTTPHLAISHKITIEFNIFYKVKNAIHQHQRTPRKKKV